LTISAKFIARPNLRFLFEHPAHFISMGFGLGLIPMAPGTFGTLLALPLYWGLQHRLDSTQMLITLACMFVAGVWFCGKTGRDFGVEDHKTIVWDETAAFMLVLFFTPDSPIWQAFAFLLFRLFDIFKPGPVGYLEKRYRGGFGVMVDDLAAAFCTLLCLTLASKLLPVLGV